MTIPEGGYLRHSCYFSADHLFLLCSRDGNLYVDSQFPERVNWHIPVLLNMGKLGHSLLLGAGWYGTSTGQSLQGTFFPDRSGLKMALIVNLTLKILK
jgi:hypothetical protein